MTLYGKVALIKAYGVEVRKVVEELNYDELHAQEDEMQLCRYSAILKTIIDLGMRMSLGNRFVCTRLRGFAVDSSSAHCRCIDRGGSVDKILDSAL